MAYDPYENVQNPYVKKFLMFFHEMPEGKKFPMPYTADPNLKVIVEELANHLKSIVAKQFKMPSPELQTGYTSSNTKRWDDGAYAQLDIHVIQDYGDFRLDVYFPFYINRKGYCHGSTINFDWFYTNDQPLPVIGGDGERVSGGSSADATSELPNLYKLFRKSVQDAYKHKTKQIRELNRAMAMDATNTHGIDMEKGKRFGWQLIILKRFMKAYKIQLPTV